MEQSLLFLMSNIPDSKKWLRSEEERKLQTRFCSDIVIFVTAYAKRLANTRCEFVFFDEDVQQQKNFGKYEIVVNLCNGSDLDGMIGPSLSRSLETRKIKFVGTQSDFAVTTIDKKKLFSRLSESGIRTKTPMFFNFDDRNKITLPVIVSLADSYSKKSIHVTEKEHWKLVSRDFGETVNLLMADTIQIRDVVYTVFVCETDKCSKESTPQQVVDFAKMAYHSIRGTGLAIVQVSCTNSECWIDNIDFVGAWFYLREQHGIDTAIRMLNVQIINFIGT